MASKDVDWDVCSGYGVCFRDGVAEEISRPDISLLPGRVFKASCGWECRGSDLLRGELTHSVAEQR
jgi:hypothetical protein